MGRVREIRGETVGGRGGHHRGRLEGGGRGRLWRDVRGKEAHIRQGQKKKKENCQIKE